MNEGIHLDLDTWIVPKPWGLLPFIYKITYQTLFGVSGQMAMYY